MKNQLFNFVLKNDKLINMTNSQKNKSFSSDDITYTIMDTTTFQHEIIKPGKPIFDLRKMGLNRASFWAENMVRFNDVYFCRNFKEQRYWMTKIAKFGPNDFFYFLNIAPALVNEDEDYYDGDYYHCVSLQTATSYHEAIFRTSEQLIRALESLPPAMRCVHEVLYGPVLTYFDIDIDRYEYAIDDETFDELKSCFMADIKQCFREFIKIKAAKYPTLEELIDADWVVYNSHNDDKISYHAHIITEQAWESTHALKILMTDFVKYYDGYGLYPKRYIDVSVYRRNGMLRTFGSFKQGTNRALKIDPLTDIAEPSADQTFVHACKLRDHYEFFTYREVVAEVKHLNVPELELRAAIELILRNPIGGGMAYRETTNNTIVFNRMRPTHCDHCGRTHHNDNTLFARIGADGEVLVYCRKDEPTPQSR